MATLSARFRIARTGFTLDAALDVPLQGVIALFGPSGSGKTTLLRCVAGLEHPTDGYLAVAGEIWQDGLRWVSPHQRPIGYVFQDANLFPHLTVLDNLRFGLRRSHQPANSAALDGAVELLDLAPLLSRRPEHLSGGERQRVAIARALAVQPTLLLMDEPLASLETARKREILPFLERLHDEAKIPILYVTHSPDEVARLADYLVAIEGGRVTAHGPLAEVLSRADLPIRLGEEAGVVVEGKIGERDTVWHLARADFAGGHLWARDHGFSLGHRVRLRILARDVSLAVAPPSQTSIQNVLTGTVASIGSDLHPGLALVRVLVGETYLLARLTQRSADALGITAGKPVYIQVKSVALME